MQVRETVTIGERTLVVERPRDSEALLDEHAFEHEEYLPYWAELWPSALALAELAAASALPQRVLELGCGLGLPSIVAALAGAQVLATDWAPDAIAATRANARLNGAQLDARVWRWDDAPPGEPWPLVIGADLLYEPRNGPLLLAALARLVAPGGEAWIADPDRPPARAFFDAATAAGWRIDELAHSGPPSVMIRRLAKVIVPRSPL